MEKVLITVFTPTYNRAHTLHRVYDSLKAQTCTNFEWIIVDDGSKDNTQEIVENWIQENTSMKIKLYFQENSGKHIAINHGVSKASGEFFLIADSDDGFVPKTLEIFVDAWDSIPNANKESFAGVWCLCQDINGTIVGDEFPSTNWDAKYFDRIYKHQLKGEKWHIEKLSVMKEFPFPNLKVGEGFYFGESTIWNRIYRKYNARHINSPLRVYYESADGIMAQIANNPHRDKTVTIGAKEQFNNDIRYFFYSPKAFLLLGHAYWKSCKNLNISFGESIQEITMFPSKLFLIMIYPFSRMFRLLKSL